MEYHRKELCCLFLIIIIINIILLIYMLNFDNKLNNYINSKDDIFKCKIIDTTIKHEKDWYILTIEVINVMTNYTYFINEKYEYKYTNTHIFKKSIIDCTKTQYYKDLELSFIARYPVPKTTYIENMLFSNNFTIIISIIAICLNIIICIGNNFDILKKIYYMNDELNELRDLIRKN